MASGNKGWEERRAWLFECFTPHALSLRRHLHIVYADLGRERTAGKLKKGQRGDEWI